MMGVLTVNESECCGVNPMIRITSNSEGEVEKARTGFSEMSGNGQK
jgi:hypothetical protein